MRTTVNIDEHVLAAAKDAARASGLTLGEFIQRSLQRGLLEYDRKHEPEVALPTSSGQPAAGLDVTSNQQLYAILDEGVALDRLR